MALKLLMMGSGEFGVPTFRAICESHHDVVGLVTQPDRRGRGHHRHRNPMKEWAVQQGLPVFQPERINTDESVARLRAFAADLFVVAAYGQILAPRVIEIPRLGVINVHASVLPKYRGAAPVQYAILNGDTETGVTIFQIQPELDAGPILAVQTTPIQPKETAGELEARLAELAAPLVVRVIDGLEAGTLEAQPQDASRATRAPRLKKSDGAIDWSQPAVRIERHIRAMQPWPKAFTALTRSGGQSMRVCLIEAEPVDVQSLGPPEKSGQAGAGSALQRRPGDVVLATRKRVVVQTGEGGLDILRIQPEAKRVMRIEEFLCGHPLQPGDRFHSL
ncbi:MAG TPA: methionyl-tRNA formyltransferase [Planctomycetaceae bacterium]|nr:methionyl-tRNA formyltransferase [Planctomycetaceae bacterium]